MGIIRQATMKDAKNIQKVVNAFASGGKMLSLSMNEIYEKIMEFLLYEEDGMIIGVCALHPMWSDLAEIRSLAVRHDLQRKGVGRMLVEAQMLRAKELNITNLFAFTYEEKFFDYMGFKVVPFDSLPKKVWTDCLKCVKYPECDEIAMERMI